MPHSILYGAQVVHLIAFAFATFSVEWRKPGLIQLGFALFYLNMGFVDEALIAADGAMHKLLFTYLDLLGAALIFTLCYPSGHNKVFRPFYWLGLTSVLILFQTAHYLNYRSAEGLIFGLHKMPYEFIVVGLAVVQLLFNIPGIKDGFRECKKMAPQALALSRSAPSRFAEIFRRKSDNRNRLGGSGMDADLGSDSVRHHRWDRSYKSKGRP